MHRDIKPDNLMVISYKPPRGIITDFGHATLDKTYMQRPLQKHSLLPGAGSLGSQARKGGSARIRPAGGEKRLVPMCPDSVRTDRSPVAALIRRMLDRAPDYSGQADHV